MSDDEKSDMRPLKKMIADFGGLDRMYVKVGILGDDNSRAEQGYGNAEIGAVHEFGCDKRNIPQRSFLITPITDHLKEVLNKLDGKFLDAAWKQNENAMEKLTRKLGAACQKIVQKAFSNEGYGTWPESERVTANFKRFVKEGVSISKADKKSGNTLVDTGQLRDSISFEVVK